MKRAFVAVVLSLPLVCGLSPRARGAETPPAQTLAEVEARIREVLERTKTPGAGIALVSRDAVLWQAGLGKADVASGRDATAETLFRVGSISKAFVGVAALMLVEEGLLTLETPVRAIVPEVEFENPWESTDPVRIIHLLEHTTGFDDMTLAEYAHSEPGPAALRDALAFRTSSRVSRWRPGTRMSYCNSGPAIAAHVIERITGRRFEDFIADRIFVPLGMTSATYFRDEAHADRYATLYRADGTTPVPYWHIIFRPVGAINASAAEMARFAQMLLGRGVLGDARLLTPGSVERMEEPQTTYAARAGLRTGYGLGNYATVADGFVFHGHDGGVEGGLAKLEYLPQEGLGLVVLLNAANGSALNEIAGILRGYLTKDLARPALAMATTLSPDVREALDGTWCLENPRTEVTRTVLDLTACVSVDSGTEGFHLHRFFGGEPLPFVSVGGRLFRGQESPVADMVLAETAEGLRLASSNGQCLRRASGFVVWGLRIALACSLLLLAATIPFALVWIPLKVLGRLGSVRHLGPRVWGLCSALAFFGMHAVVALSAADAIARFGRVTVWSVGLFGLSVAFAGATVAGVYSSWRARQAEQDAVACWFARATALGALLLVVWYARFGIIGVRTWL